MKNAVIAVLLITSIVAGYVAATSNLRLTLEGLEGKLEKIVRGDLRLPISATGEVRPSRRIEVKSEASGEVQVIARQAGERVRVGDLLIRLQQDDEQRSVDRARQELQIAKARLETARVRLDLAKGPDISTARTQVEQLEPLVELALFRKKRLEELEAHLVNEEEMLQRRVDYSRQVAQWEQAKANLEKAQLTIPLAEHDLISAEATYQAAQSTLADAEKRLAKTDILSPINGVVADIRVQIGEVIQGGMTTLTGGTILAVLLDSDRLLVRAEVDESDIGRVLNIAPPWAQPGRESEVRAPEDFQAAAAAMEYLPEITVESFREKTFHGLIERVFPEPRTLSGVVTYLVDLVVTSENRHVLLPGMRADISFTSEHVENVVLCPNEAIREGPGGRLGVHVPDESAPASERATRFIPCTFGLDNGTFSEVREGLSEGMMVYTRLPRQPDRDRRRGR